MADTKLFKPENNKSGTFSSTLSAVGTSAILVTPIPTVAPGVIVAEAGTTKEEHIYYSVRDTGTNTISGLIRDITSLNGGVGFEHLANSPWEVLQAAEYVTNIIDSIQEGYQQEMQAIARVNATSFTVFSNRIAYYTKGRLVRSNRDDAKISRVTGSSYNAGTGLTTVTIDLLDIPSPLTYIEYDNGTRGFTDETLAFFAADTGVADAYAVTLPFTLGNYVEGLTIAFKAVNANTGAATLNVNGLGVKDIRKSGAAVLASGDIAAGQIIELVYDGARFQSTSGVSSAAITKATSAEINTGSNDAKFVTALGLKGSILWDAEGWATDGVTWTRTGNHTFTIPTDLTARYQKGTKVRYKDGGAFEYGVVASSSYSNPDTTVTLITNTSHTMSAVDITENAYSYAENPQGFPDWFIYAATPSWNGTAPSGTTTTLARFSVKGRQCFVYAEQNNTVAGASNSQVTFNGPVAADITASFYHAFGSGVGSTAQQDSLPTTNGRCVLYHGTPQIYLFLDATIAARSFILSGNYPI